MANAQRMSNTDKAEHASWIMGMVCGDKPEATIQVSMPAPNWLENADIFVNALMTIKDEVMPCGISVFEIIMEPSYGDIFYRRMAWKFVDEECRKLFSDDDGCAYAIIGKVEKVNDRLVFDLAMKDASQAMLFKLQHGGAA